MRMLHIRPFFPVSAAICLSLAGFYFFGNHDQKIWQLRTGNTPIVSSPSVMPLEAKAGSNEGMDPDLKSIRYLSQIMFEPSASNGLQAAFSGAEVRYTDGSTSQIPPSTLNVPDNAVTYIMLTMHDLKLHALPKNIHRGGIPIAKITAKNGRINVSSENVYRMPVSRIPLFLNKLRHGEQTRVAVIGDSFELRFDNPNIRVDQYTAGGQTSHFGLSLAGFNSDGGDSSPLLHSGYDLAIVGFSTHKGSETMKVLESLVIKLRETGIEVILLTANPSKDQKDFLSAETNQIAKIADKWDAELADTWSFVSEKMDQDDDIYSSRLQLDQKGYKIWEDAVQSVIHTMNPVPDPPKKITSAFLVHDGSLPFDAHIYVPASFTGTLMQEPNTDPKASLLLGTSNGSPAQYLLPAGSSALFNLTGSQWGMDLLIKDQSNFEAVILDDNGKLLNTVSIDNPHQRLDLLEALPIQDTPYNIEGPLTVKVTSGEMNLIGASAYSITSTLSAEK